MVGVRKRPRTRREAKEGDFDAVTCMARVWDSDAKDKEVKDDSEGLGGGGGGGSGGEESLPVFTSRTADGRDRGGRCSCLQSCAKAGRCCGFRCLPRIEIKFSSK